MGGWGDLGACTELSAIRITNMVISVVERNKEILKYLFYFSCTNVLNVCKLFQHAFIYKSSIFLRTFLCNRFI